MSAATAPKCNEIGNLFASQYYRHLVSSPDTAHNFYHAEAGFSRLRGSAPSEIVGHDKIKEYIASYNYASCKLKIDTIDSQEKGKNEIIVLVSGIEIDEDKVVRPFCQTFCLEAISGTRYLVRNDILCYLRNELLNIGEQKVEAQPEMLETPPEEPVELKEEHAVPVHVDMGTQADLSIEEPTPAKEEDPLPLTPQPVEAPIQPISQPKQHKPTRADTKRELADPSKPRAWSSVVGGITSGGLPGQTNIPASEPVVINSQEPVSAEEEIVTTPVSTVTTVAPTDKPRAYPPRSEVLNSLYVSNFEPGCDIEEVNQLFSQFGKVKAVKYVPPQSYLFVDYETAESADKALKGGPIRLGDFDLKCERRKVQVGFNSRGRGGPRGRGVARGRGGPPRDSRPEPRTTDRTERREPRESRPREGNDRAASNRPANKDERGRSGRGRGAPRGGVATTPAS